MFQNLKVDIIYYRTNTDFEMEFNLCGCCRMRLLTDKSPDKKAVLHSLSRAVSRSRIIIITGALFGDDGIINLVSKAIETRLEAVDNKTYGISGDEAIKILKGATPLVTADGYFGGCIIESGPQTMVLVSENKNIRKYVMENLIHPYIEQLCAIELSEKAAATTDTSKNDGVNEDELTALEQEYEIIAEEFIAEDDNGEIITEEFEDTEDGEESDLLVDDNSDAENEEGYVSLEEEYESIANALLTEEHADNEEEYDEDNEVELPLILDDQEEDRKEFYLEEENKKIAESLLTDEEEIGSEEEVDTEIRDGIDSPILMEDGEEEKEINMDNEYELFANTLITDSDKNDDLVEDIEESETDLAEREKFISSGMIYEAEDVDSNSNNFKQSNKNRANSPISINLFILLIIAVLLIVLAILCYALFFVPQSNGLDTVEYIKETFNTLFGKA